MLTLTGVVIGVDEDVEAEPETEPDAAETDTERKGKKKRDPLLVVYVGAGKARKVHLLSLPAGYTQSRFDLDVESHLEVDVDWPSTGPFKGRKHYTLIRIHNAAPWKGNGKGRHHEAAEPMAVTQ
jgi:hypothetical protein